MGYIYCITNLINSKRYVGKTTLTIQDRFQEHCHDSKKERCEKRPLYDAFNKYGIENFKIEELEYVEDDALLDKREVYWIKELETYGRNGYNASKGGDGKLLYNHNEIIELARLGYTVDIICEKIGCKVDTVYKVLKANGVKFRRKGSKLIGQYDLAGNFIQIFFGSVEAMKWLYEKGIAKNIKGDSHILKCCNHKNDKAYGYKWEFIPEPN
jgi:hypothetical protein